MKYDFDTTLDHRKNASYRWGMPDMPNDVIGMGTADLDFTCAPCIREAPVPIEALVALFVMLGSCLYIGYDWDYIDKAMAVDTLVNCGGFSSMLSLVGILLVLGMLSGLFDASHVLSVLVNNLSKKLNTPASILFGAWLSSLIICLIGGQYPAIAIPAVAFKGVCDDTDIHRAVLSRTLEDVGAMVAAIIPWSAWVIGYGVVLGGVGVKEFIPYTFLPMLCSVLALINNYFGIGLYRSGDEVKYRPL